ncbi:MAG: response regulator transcription factor [Acidimicrobiales bacterium]
MRRSIVVVEDEQAIASAVAARLESEGFDVSVAADGPAGVDVVERVRPDLVVLDLMLPGLDGLEVCRRIQRDRRVPVLMLTARDSETDKVVGLSVGADDYLTKPFSPRELVARVQAILRRADEAAVRTDAPADAEDEVLHVGTIEIDVAGRRVRRDDEAVHLTPTEFDLLVFLARRPGVVRTREQLLAEVWGYRDGSGARTVDSHVRAIRRKLGNDVIRTVHAVGYSVEDGRA